MKPEDLVNPEDLLEASLLDLLYELREADVPLILGGGYGLYRKRRHALESGERLLIPSVPAARSTNDLEIFLRTEVIADPEHVKELRGALDRLDYQVVPTARHYQFLRTLSINGQDHQVKIDLLTKRPNPGAYPTLQVDDRRVRPRPSVDLHAHTTDEAQAIEDEPLALVVSGPRTTGELYEDTVYVPQTYPYLTMKLFAFRDQHDKEVKGYGREHALDLYTLAAIMTESDLETTQTLARKYDGTPEAREAARIVHSLFETPQSLGMLRLREHQLFSRAMDVPRFLTVLQQSFPQEVFPLGS